MGRLALFSFCLTLVTEAVRKRQDDEAIYNLQAEANYFNFNFSKHFSQSRDSMVTAPYSLHSALTQTSMFTDGLTAREMRLTLGLKYFPWKSTLGAYSKLNEFLRNEYYKFGTRFLDSLLLLATATTVIHLQDVNRLENIYRPMYVRHERTIVNLEAIQSYIASRSEDSILVQLTPDMPVSLGLVLVDTFVMKAEWHERFYLAKTYRRPFKSLDPDTDVAVMVDMMTGVRTVGWQRHDDFKLDVVEVPLLGREIGFYIFLPHEDRGLMDVEQQMQKRGKTPSSLAEWLTPTVVRLGIPKMWIQTSINLKQVLQDMGMVSAFNSTTADFSQLLGLGRLHLTDVIHATTIGVNEDGISTSTRQVPNMTDNTFELAPQQTFIADHPFTFLVRHNYLGRVLVSGKYMGP